MQGSLPKRHGSEIPCWFPRQVEWEQFKECYRQEEAPGLRLHSVQERESATSPEALAVTLQSFCREHSASRLCPSLHCVNALTWGTLQRGVVSMPLWGDKTSLRHMALIPEQECAASCSWGLHEETAALQGPVCLSTQS